MNLGSLRSKSLLFRLSSSSTTQSPRRAIAVLVTYFPSSTFSTTTGSNFGSGSSLSPSRRPQYDEESRSVRVSVWWDFQNCNLPAGANVFKVAQSITAVIRNNGIKGPISITAFGDILQLTRSNQDALSATGICLTHVPQGGKNSADRSLLTDLMCWVSQNPPPAHLFLISNDIGFANVLHRLRMNNYNILLASKSSAPGVLCSAASIMWDWDALSKGEIVTGKYFNQPPDGPYNSWYGHYRTPLLDPFATTTTEQQSSTVKIEEITDSSSSSDSVISNAVKLRPVPKEVVNKIRSIVSLYPKGAPMSELRTELMKRNLAIDKDFYGHKKFSLFLLSMPDILQVDTSSKDGLFIVRAATEKTTPTQVDSSPGLSSAVNQKVKEKETVNASSPKVISNVELAAEKRGDESLGKKQEKVTNDDKHVKVEAPEISKHVKVEATEIPQEPILVSQEDVKANDKPSETNQVALIAMSDSSMEVGFFQKLKRFWYGSLAMESQNSPETENKTASPEMESEDSSENKTVSGSGDKEKEDKDLKSSSEEANPVAQNSPSFVGESVEEEKVGTDEAGKKDTAGFLSRILKSFNFWGRNTEHSNVPNGNQELINVDSQVDDIFAKEFFWNNVESFINSPRGFTVVYHSKTRELLAKNLQKEGPSCLRQLDESSMLHLVTLLISDKKLIEENLSSSLPFSIIKVSSPTHRPASNGLSSIFSDCVKLPSQKQDGDKRLKNVAHAGVSVGSTMERKQQMGGYKSNAIADCMKLIKKITEKNPEGYSMIRFRKEFLEEYGYHLAVEKLGHENLQSLLQEMPGVRVSSGYILPLTTSQDAKSIIKEDGLDSSFEELGPVSDATKKVPVYEPSLSEDEDSDSEGDNNPRQKQKKEMNGEDVESSLVQILESFKIESKDGEVKKLVSSSNSRKQKHVKTYSFVKDPEVQ